MLTAPVGTRTYTDPVAGTHRWEYGTWTSPAVAPGFGAEELIASWTATTPGRTWVEVQARGLTTTDAQTGWFVLGRWCRLDPSLGGGISRTSVPGQRTALAQVLTDTLRTATGVRLRHVQLRVLLLRPAGTTLSPTLRSASVLCSAAGAAPAVTSAPGPARGLVLPVPARSQVVHTGHYPQWGGGGEAWCSPTSTTMVAGRWGRWPSAADLTWVAPGADREVDHAARGTFDRAYAGCGNWPFAVAYAGGLGLEGFVTRLRSLREAETWVAAGVPLVLSVSFARGELDGAGYGTAGHLMVLRGFDAAGNPVVNDPASHLRASNDQVRVTYRRDQLERLWVGHSRGTAYVIHPRGQLLPPVPGQSA